MAGLLGSLTAALGRLLLGRRPADAAAVPEPAPPVEEEGDPQDQPAQACPPPPASPPPDGQLPGSGSGPPATEQLIPASSSLPAHPCSAQPQVGQPAAQPQEPRQQGPEGQLAAQRRPLPPAELEAELEEAYEPRLWRAVGQLAAIAASGAATLAANRWQVHSGTDVLDVAQVGLEGACEEFRWLFMLMDKKRLGLEPEPAWSDLLGLQPPSRWRGSFSYRMMRGVELPPAGGLPGAYMNLLAEVTVMHGGRRARRRVRRPRARGSAVGNGGGGGGDAVDASSVAVSSLSGNLPDVIGQVGLREAEIDYVFAPPRHGGSGGHPPVAATCCSGGGYEEGLPASIEGRLSAQLGPRERCALRVLHRAVCERWGPGAEAQPPPDLACLYDTTTSEEDEEDEEAEWDSDGAGGPAADRPPECQPVTWQ